MPKGIFVAFSEVQTPLLVLNPPAIRKSKIKNTLILFWSRFMSVVERLVGTLSKAYIKSLIALVFHELFFFLFSY